MSKWRDGTPKSGNNAFTGVIYRPEETETDRRERAMTENARKRNLRGQFGSIEKLSAEAILKDRHGGAYTRAVSLFQAKTQA